VSKRQLKKIKQEGHFEGKNKTYFDDSGNALSAEEYRKKERLQANKEDVEYNPIEHIQERMEKNREEDDNLEKERRKILRRKRETKRELSRKP
jgi:hypothetical protein